MDMLCECLECSGKEIVKASDIRKDGRPCKKCGGHLIPIAYAGLDLALAGGTDKK